MKIRLILNALKASYPDLHDAIRSVRQHQLFSLDVRLAYLIEDLPRLIEEAIEHGIERIVVGGGDGTIHHLLNALMRFPASKRPQLAILPLGTANDFATAAQIPLTPYEALLLAINGQSIAIDVAQVNDRYFLNVASAGFGAQITTQTPPGLKNILGGSAYALTGLLKLFSFLPFRGRMRIGEYQFIGSSFATAVCNGRQAGGGMILSPQASIDDGLLDVVLFTLDPVELPNEYFPPSETLFGGLPFKKILRVPEVEFFPESTPPQINLDGEPYEAENFAFRLHSKILDMVLPENCPMLKGS